MSVDSKIKDMLVRMKAKATDAESLSEEGTQPMGSTSVAKDMSIKPAVPGDASNPMQGSSQMADYEERDEDEENQGQKVSSKIVKNTIQVRGPIGTAPNFTTVADPSMAVNQMNSQGNVQKEGYTLKKTSVRPFTVPDEDGESEEIHKAIKYKIVHNKTGKEVGTAERLHDPQYRSDKMRITMHTGDERYVSLHSKEDPQAALNDFFKDPKTSNKYKTAYKTAPKAAGVSEDFEHGSDTEEYSLKEQIVSIFGEDISEEFIDKATSIFEAAVIARVNSELEKVVEELQEQSEIELVEAKEELVEKVDAFLNYVVEQWMTENELAIENGLRTEIAEEFISGLKSLFKEHYIEVPEEKYNLVSELQVETKNLEQKLNEALEYNIQMRKELEEMKRISVIEHATKDLADTEVERLVKLVEGVDFDNENLFAEKIAVIKENYFPKGNRKQAQNQSVFIEDEQNDSTETLYEDSTVSHYAKALSRTIKKK